MAAAAALFAARGIRLRPEWSASILSSLPANQRSADDLYAQWLRCDLADTAPEAVVLPQGNPATLSSNIHVQIYEVINVGDSAFSQLDEAMRAAGRWRGADTSLDDGNADAIAIPIRQGLHARNKLLKMRLSDGHDYILGMEFRTIAGLPRDIPPGTKLLVRKGTVIRSGVLLLQPGSVEVLGGGGVPALQREHNYVRVLQRCFADGDEDADGEDADGEDLLRVAAPAEPLPPLVAAPQPAAMRGSGANRGAGRGAGRGADRGRGRAGQPQRAPVAPVRAAVQPAHQPHLEAAASQADPMVIEDDDEDDDEDLLAIAEAAEAQAHAEAQAQAAIGVQDEEEGAVSPGASAAETVEVEDMDDDDAFLNADALAAIAAAEAGAQSQAAAAPATAGQWMKGTIVEFIEHLQVKDGLWCMKVAIDNGQGGQPIVVSLADQLLEKMTDISAVRFREKRKLSKRDPAIKEQLRETLLRLETVLGSGQPADFRLLRDASGRIEVVEALFKGVWRG